MASRQFELDTSGGRWRFRETEASRRRNAREAEDREYRKQFRAKAGWRIATLVALLVALIPALLIFTFWKVPSEDEARVTLVEQAPPAFVDDPADLLDPEQELLLLDAAEDLPHPSTVQQLRFIVFDDSLDNVNDSVENFMRDTYPDEIGPDYFADGTMIVGAAMKTRHQFIFAGEDVADQLALRGSSHLDKSLEAMEDGLKAGDIPRGLIDGAARAMDPDEVLQFKAHDMRLLRNLVWIPIGFGAFAATFAFASVPVRLFERRKQRVFEAREGRQLLIDAHSSLALRLQELDIRANSLSSRFVNGELRQQWAQVRDRFLAIDTAIASLPVDTDRDALRNYRAIDDAAQTIKDIQQAEDNINLLFRMDQGDVDVRRERLTELRQDALDATEKARKAKDVELVRGLDQTVRRIDALAADLAAPTFMDTFVRLLGDYRIIMGVLKDREFKARKGVEDLQAPRLWERDYRYPAYFGYSEITSWNSTTNSPSSSGSNSGFSSGFSGSGGSSSF
ncbi:MAG: hypothetical protein DI609_07890 [Corynebacterium urealyticum]|uniref:DUF5129 domain-containing protein n=1 Tax=Corynebacterium urealyticum TaxID=43771 RepID=A0A2W5B2A4_9CORY|nr:MAG: hypothetical protein DI609_07890 [Corynebacterium urealyticum]